MRGGLVGRRDILERAIGRCRRGGGGVLFAGAAGVGKTRLLDEVVARLARDGWWTERFVASEATSSIPFGPLVSLLPREPDDDPARLLPRARDELLRRADGRHVTLAVDDAHFLDDGSLALLADLVHEGAALVLLTVRTGEDVPAALTALWTSDAVERIDVPPLGRAEIIELAEGFAGGPLAGELADEVARLAGGNPLLLRELLMDARATSAIQLEGTTWVRTRRLRSGPRLRELVGARVRGLAPAERHTIELVAVGEPLAIDVLDGEEARALDALEERQLLKTEASARGWVARSDHPLIGESMRAGMATRRRVELLCQLADRLVAAGLPKPGDALRAARWHLDAGRRPSGAVALAAAREAMAALDLDGAAELAGLAFADGAEGCEPYLLLGEILRLQGRHRDAAATLAQAAERADADRQLVRIAMLRSSLLAHELGDVQAAIALLEEASDQVTDRGRALELVSEASYLSGLLGRFRDVVRTTRRILARRDLDDDTLWTTTINVLYAQVMLGELAGVEDHVERAVALAPAVQVDRPEAVDLLWALRSGVYIQRGQLAAGEHVVGDHVRRCRSDGYLHGLTSAIYLQLLLLRGSPDVFVALSDTLHELEHADPFVVHPIAAGLAALAYGRAGRVADAAAVLDTVPEDLVDVRARPFVARGRAALLALSEGPHVAAEVAAEGGREAVASSHISFGVLALHDAVRHGRPELVVTDLEEATEHVDAPLLLTMRDHARGLADGEGKALDAVGERFASMGARVLAGVAFAHAAAAHPPDGLAARRSATRARLWAAASEPFLVPRVPEAVDVISDRELEVAARAAGGPTSRQIAEELFLSVRTVDNHLRRIYDKLGIAGRSQLSEVLSPIPDRPATG